MIVKAFDKTAEYAKVTTFDKDEREDGETAFASLLYEEGAQLSARLLVALWLITVWSTRIIEFFDNRAKQKKLEAESKPQLQLGLSTTDQPK